MFDKTVDYSLAAFKLVPDWFVTRKMIKGLFTALYAGENILYFNDDCFFLVMKWIFVDLNNINLDNNFDEDDPETIY